MLKFMSVYDKSCLDLRSDLSSIALELVPVLFYFEHFVQSVFHQRELNFLSSSSFSHTVFTGECFLCSQLLP